MKTIVSLTLLFVASLVWAESRLTNDYVVELSERLAEVRKAHVNYYSDGLRRTTDTIYLGDDLPSDVVAAMRASCVVPQDVNVIGLVGSDLVGSMTLLSDAGMHSCSALDRTTDFVIQVSDWVSWKEIAENGFQRGEDDGIRIGEDVCFQCDDPVLGPFMERLFEMVSRADSRRGITVHRDRLPGFARLEGTSAEATGVAAALGLEQPLEVPQIEPVELNPLELLGVSSVPQPRELDNPVQSELPAVIEPEVGGVSAARERATDAYVDEVSNAVARALEAIVSDDSAKTEQAIRALTNIGESDTSNAARPNSSLSRLTADLQRRNEELMADLGAAAAEEYRTEIARLSDQQSRAGRQRTAKHWRINNVASSMPRFQNGRQHCYLAAFVSCPNSENGLNHKFYVEPFVSRSRCSAVFPVGKQEIREIIGISGHLPAIREFDKSCRDQGYIEHYDATKCESLADCDIWFLDDRLHGCQDRYDQDAKNGYYCHIVSNRWNNEMFETETYYVDE